MFTKFTSKKMKSVAYLTLGFGIAFTSFANAATQIENATYEKKSDYSNSGVSDQELLKKINDKISSGWFTRGFDKVVVRVNNGVVTLQGSVNTRDEKDKVEKEVRNIEGVKSLNSNLSVIDSSKHDNDRKKFKDKYSTSADDQLNKKIRDDVSRGWLWDSYKDVILNTSNGVVTLEGTIASQRDEQKLISEIQKIEGVNAIKSNLIIKK